MNDLRGPLSRVLSVVVHCEPDHLNHEGCTQPWMGKTLESLSRPLSVLDVLMDPNFFQSEKKTAASLD